MTSFEVSPALKRSSSAEQAVAMQQSVDGSIQVGPERRAVGWRRWFKKAGGSAALLIGEPSFDYLKAWWVVK